MGVVFRARQLSLDRTVAVKLLLLGSFAGPGERARFQREAAAAARLRHPHLVPVYEVGEHEGQPFFSMEFVAGRDLAARVQAQPLAPAEAARLLEQVARAIQHAHEQGVVHRDLKPSNVLVDEAGNARVTDFGLAKHLADDGLELTITGQVLGTPGFLAPERVSTTRKPDSSAPQPGDRHPGPSPAGSGTEDWPPQFNPRAADIYSLGAMLYHALTGRAPFAGASVAETLRQVAENEPPSPRLLNPALPRDLETIALKCLAKDPTRRYATAGELAEELARFRRGEPIRARPVAPAERAWRWSRRHPARAVLVGLLALLALGGPPLAWHMNRLRLAAERFAAESRERLIAAHIANGLRLAEANVVAEALPWFVEALALDAGNAEREQPHRLRVGTMLAQQPPLRWFRELDGPVRDLWFSEDGERLVTWVNNERGQPALRAWAVSDGEFRALPPRPANAHDALAVSRDVTQLVLPAPHGATMFRRADTNVLTRELTLGEPASVACFSADGLLAALGTPGGQVRVFRTATGEPVAPASAHTGAINELLFDPRGLRLAVRHGGRLLRVWDLATGRGSRNLGRFHAVSALAFGPTLDELLVTSRDGQADIWNVFTVTRKFELRADTELTAAAWARDRELVATAGRDGRVRVWDPLTRLDRTPVLSHGTNVLRLAFSPDSRRLATVSAAGLLRVWQLEPSGKRPAGSSNLPAPNPDGLTVELGFDQAVRVRYHGQPISPPLRHPEVTQVRLDTNRLEVIARNAQGAERRWPVVADGRPLAELRRLTELLAARRLRATGELEPLSADELRARWRPEP